MFERVAETAAPVLVGDRNAGAAARRGRVMGMMVGTTRREIKHAKCEKARAELMRDRNE